MSNSKPIIGIVGKVQPKDESIWINHIDTADEFRYQVVRHGGIPITILPTNANQSFNDTDTGDDTVLSSEELADLYTQMELCDGFILQGGLYSCSYEVEVAKKAIRDDKPIIGTCAGFNNILRALGGEVDLDESGSHDCYDRAYRHKVTLEEDTKIYEIIGEKELMVNSVHTMIAPEANVLPYAKISSHSYDGLVESIEAPGKRFVIGVKWHPEIMQDEPHTDKLFRAFVKAARR